MNCSSNNSFSFMRKSQDRDGSLKENAEGINDPAYISARRKTMFFNPQATSTASITGRRQTMFIDTPKLPAKNQKRNAASSTTIVYPCGILKKSPPAWVTPKNDISNSIDNRMVTPLLPAKTAPGRLFKSSLERKARKAASVPLQLKSQDCLTYVPNRSSFSLEERRSSLYRDESPLQRSPSSLVSSTYRSDSSSHSRDSASHRHDSSNGCTSSSKRIESQSHSPSSESSANRSVQNYNAKKRRSSNGSGHTNHEKRIRLAKSKCENTVLCDISATKTSKAAKKASETPNNSSSLGKCSEDCKSRKHKSTSMKQTPADKSKSSLSQKGSKRNGSTTTAARDKGAFAQHKNTVPKNISADTLWNPVVTLHRLKVDSLKKYEKNRREIIVSDDSYSVYCVNGKIKINKKKVKTLKTKSNQHLNLLTEWRQFTRDFGVQKDDEEQLEKAKQNRISFDLFNESIQEYQTALHEQDKHVESLYQVINERENKVAERERMIAERDSQITERAQMIEERDIKIADRDLKIKEYEEKFKLQEKANHVMALQMDRLKQSKENLFKLLKEQEAKLKALTADKSVPALKPNSSILPIRVKNINELRQSHTQSKNAVNPTNAMRNSDSPNEHFSGVPSSIGWHTTETQSSQSSTQPSCSQSTQYLQMVTPSTSYMYMHNVQQSTQSTTLAAKTHNAQSTIPQPSINSNTAPHQNLPKIIQRSGVDRGILQRPSSQINPASQNGPFDRVSCFTQNGFGQTPAISHMRNRAKSCYYGSHPMLQQQLRTPQIPHQMQSHQLLQQTPSQSNNMHLGGMQERTKNLL